MIVTIIYNEHNVDSVVATVALKKLISEKFKNELVVFNMVSTQRDIKEKDLVDGKQDIYVVGVELSKDSLNLLHNFNTTMYSYNESQTVKSPIRQLKPIDDSLDVETSKNNSTLSLVMSDKEFEKEIEDLDAEKQKKLFSIGYLAYKYWNFKNLKKQEMTTLFANFDLLQKSAKTASVNFEFEIPDTQIDGDKLFKLHVMDSFKIKLVRGLVERNLTTHQFGDHKKSKILPTVNVPREFLHDAARIIGLAHTRLVAYEDVQSYRYWYIKASSQTLAREIAKLIPHQDAWFDGKLLCLKSELPSFHK